MHIVRRSAFKAVPWKNGGGITHEVTRVPAATPAVAGADAFRWRVSVAEIDASGPFSEFPDHHRIMVLLRGGGVRLSFSGGEPFELHSVGDCVSFDGAWSTQCTLLDGPCTDLNLMVSKASPPAHAQVLRLTESVALGEGTVTLLFAIAGAVSVHGDQGISRLDAWILRLPIRTNGCYSRPPRTALRRRPFRSCSARTWQSLTLIISARS